MPLENDSLLQFGGSQDDDSSSLYHNPFAGHSETTFTSALRSNGTRVMTRPTLRRRVSDGAEKRARSDHDPFQGDGGGSLHLRSRTAGSSVASTSRAKHHPLARHPRGSKSSNNIVSLNDTRPGLKRLLSDMGAAASSTFRDNSKDSDPEHSPVSEVSGQRTVIVHEVSSTDSLAGVALKYGVSLADIRRANQMWASDTIHLRKVLYIPLEKTQKSKQFNFVLTNLGTESPPHVPDREEPSTVSSLIDSADGETQSNVTIRRIPASQLSYFPPPSRLSHVGTSSSSRTMPRSYSEQSRRAGLSFDLFSSMLSSSPSNKAGDNSKIHHHTPSTTPPLRSQITSLLNVFPIAPSTRDTLMARLSLDSSASTPTQCSEEQEHEMDDVGGSSLHRLLSHENVGRGLVVSKPSSSRRAEILTADAMLELRPILPPQTLVVPSDPHFTTPKRVSPRQRIAPAPYASPDGPAEQRGLFRTAQLQPSPGMQLPTKARKDERA